jgi:hypothetical protein
MTSAIQNWQEYRDNEGTGNDAIDIAFFSVRQNAEDREARRIQRIVDSAQAKLPRKYNPVSGTRELPDPASPLLQLLRRVNPRTDFDIWDHDGPHLLKAVRDAGINPELFHSFADLGYDWQAIRCELEHREFPEFELKP